MENIIEFPEINTNPMLEAPISPEEIVVALKKCKNNKTPGPDEISFEFFKNLPEGWTERVSLLFNQILEEEKVPESWTKIHLKMIYKKGRQKRARQLPPCSISKLHNKNFYTYFNN